MTNRVVWHHLILLFCLVCLGQTEPLAGCQYSQISCGVTKPTQASCVDAGCCWNPNEAEKCVVPNIQGYNFVQTGNQPGKQTFNLTLKAASGLKFGTEFPSLKFEVTQETSTRTHIKIYPTTNQSRWEVPESVIPRPGNSIPLCSPLNLL